MKFFAFVLIFSFTLSLHGQNCIDPNLIDPAAICTGVYDPVCGCDRVNYSNPCWAEVVGGVTSWTAGMCPAHNCLPIHTVSGNVTTGVYEAVYKMRSDLTTTTVNASEFVVFESEDHIDLRPEFQTILGADFSAEIGGCNDTGFTIGDASSAMNISETFYLHYGGDFYFWFEGNASMCPSSAVEIDITANGNSIYYNIVEVADLMQMPLPGFLITLTAPPTTPISINANLVQTTQTPNQGVSCFVLGDATFGYSW